MVWLDRQPIGGGLAMRRAVISALVCLGLLDASGLPAQSRVVLTIPPVYQQTPVWCWAAVGEMVFEHYGVGNINPAGNFQCGIIALLHPVCSANCFNCIVPAGSLATMRNMLTQYPEVAANITGVQARITTSVRRGPLSIQELKTEIDADRPIVAGISPSGYQPKAGVSEHVALVVGYHGDRLIVNDPFPFVSQYFASDPYLRAGGQRVGRGQYSISYDAFVERLQWREAIYRIACRGHGCGSGRGGASAGSYRLPMQSGRSCCTSVGRCGPFVGLPAMAIGEACWCSTAMGPIVGQVCRP